jgi:hypothetical protein
MSGRGINAMPGRPEGEGSARIEEQELNEAAHQHEIQEQAHANRAHRGGLFSRLFRRRSAK